MMSDLSTRMSRHHILWVEKLWSLKPYNQLREHPMAKIQLPHEIHHDELHPKFYWNPMPLPPVWAVPQLLAALDSANGPIDGIKRMISALKELKKHPRHIRGSIIDKEDRLRLDNLCHGLQEQLDFFSSKNITD